MDHLPFGTARSARTSWGAPSSSELLNAPFLEGTLDLGGCVMLPAGLPVAVLLGKAGRCPTGVLSLLLRPSRPDTGGLPHEAFPLVTVMLAHCLTSGLLNRGHSWTPVSIVAFVGAEVDTGRPAFGRFSGHFLGKQGKGETIFMVQSLYSGAFIYIKYSDPAYCITLIVVIMISKKVNFYF